MLFDQFLLLFQYQLYVLIMLLTQKFNILRTLRTAHSVASSDKIVDICWSMIAAVVEIAHIDLNGVSCVADTGYNILNSRVSPLFVSIMLRVWMRR